MRNCLGGFIPTPGNHKMTPLSGLLEHPCALKALWAPLLPHRGIASLSATGTFWGKGGKINRNKAMWKRSSSSGATRSARVEKKIVPDIFQWKTAFPLNKNFNYMLFSTIFRDLKVFHCQETPKCFYFSGSGFLKEKPAQHQHRQQKSLILWRKNCQSITSGCSLETALQMGPRNDFSSCLLALLARKSFVLVKPAEQSPSYFIMRESNGYTVGHWAEDMTWCPMSRPGL